MSKKWYYLLSACVVVCLILLVAYHYITTPVFKQSTAQNPSVTDPIFIEEEIPFELEVDKELEQKVYTIALFGTDERNLSEHSRTDTIILVRYNYETKNVQMISVPRDSFVKIPTKGKDKINAAYAYGGHELAVKTLEQLFQIEIDNYARVNFYSFLDIVNALGGVNVNVKKDIHWYDPDFKKDVTIKKGEQVLTGQTLLTYVRFRKDVDGDYGRMERQREVILSIAKEVLQPSNITKYPELIRILSKNVDSDLNWKTMLSLALEAKDFETLNIENHTLLSHSKKINGVWFEILDDMDLKKTSNQLRGLEESDSTNPHVNAETGEDAVFYDENNTQTNHSTSFQVGTTPSN